MVNIRDIAYYLSVAKKYKEEIRPIYSETLDLTSVFNVITDSSTKEAPSRRSVDADVLESISSLQSYVMNAVFSRQGNWATAELNEPLYKKVNDDGILSDKNINEINKALESDVDTTFMYIQGSSYYKEISKAVRDFVSLGTGAYKITATPSLSKPFVFEYVDLNNLFICEDSFGNPNIVFKYHYNVNATYLLDVFGQGITLPNVKEEEKETTVSVIECVIPEYDEATGMTKYNYIVILDDMQTKLMEKELTYNPFVIFRFRTEKTSPWGFGLAVDIYDTIKDLDAYKTLRKEQSAKIVNPTMQFIGNKELYFRLSDEPGAVNYLGDVNGMISADYRPSPTAQINLLPLDQDIQTCRNMIRQTFMTMPLGDAEDIKYATATAVSLRAQEFRKRFASTYELINSELLEPTFLAPFLILREKGLLLIAGEELETLALTQITFQNELTKTAEANKNMRFLQYLQEASQAMAMNQQVGGLLIKSDMLTDELAKNLNINLDLLYTQEELSAIRQAQYQQQLAMAQAQGEVDG